MIKFAILGVPGFHCLLRNFPDPSARIANFLLYTDGGSVCLPILNSDKSELNTGDLYVTTPIKYSSTNLSTALLESTCKINFANDSKLTNGNLISLGSTGFARHYFRHRCLLSFPRGTKMFQFPRLPLSNPIYSGRRHMTLLIWGFPIRTSPDQSLVSSSPELFAAPHVLHRYLMSRHSLCALE